MTADLVELAPGVRAFTLSNEHLEVTVLPDKGADIYSLVHRASGVDVLFKAPWGVRAGPMAKSVNIDGTLDRGVRGWLATAFA